MTERFELKMEENKWYFYDNVEEDYIYSKHSVCRLLNHLHQENQQWKEKLSNAIDIARLNQNDVMEFLAENRKLKEENEQLKHWNKCLAEKRHEEKGHNASLIKKLIDKIDFLERIIDGDL